MTTPQEDAELRADLYALAITFDSGNDAKKPRVRKRLLEDIDSVMQLIKARDEQREREIRIDELTQLVRTGELSSFAEDAFIILPALHRRMATLTNPQEQDKEEE